MVAGWSNFQGGSEITSGCIPDIPAGAIDFSGASQFYCDSSGYTVDVVFNGGVLPIAWATNQGQIVATGPRTAEVRIHSAVVLGTFNPTGCSTITCQPIGTSALNPVNAWAVLIQGKVYQGGVIDCEGAFCHAMVLNCFEDVACPNVGNNPETGFGYGTIGYQSGDDCGTFPYNGANLTPNPYDPDSSSCTCVDFRGVISSYPDVGWADGCNDRAPAYIGPGNSSPASCGNLRDLWVPAFKAYGAKFDVRRDELKSAGCSPCSLVQSTDIIITAVDAAGNVVIQDIPIN